MPVETTTVQAQKRKDLGAYFTPETVAAALVKWAVRDSRDRLLDPSAGDGRFLAQHRKSVGVETDPSSAALARERAPWALLHEGDFFSWAESTKERFECAVGNPPFIRYQRFAGEVRNRALQLCKRVGADFSALTSSWAPFLVAAASVLKPGGRMAFVVPAEIGHAPYAAPLIVYLLSHFGDVRLLAVRDKIFPELSEDVWVLYASGYGDRCDHLLLATAERFEFAETAPTSGLHISASALQQWNYRLRPHLIPGTTLALYAQLLRQSTTVQLGRLARVGIGYVSGANDFFHLRPSTARDLGIPKRLLRVSVRNGRALQSGAIDEGTVTEWIAQDEACLLLYLPRELKLPDQVRRYLDSRQGQEARGAYKCRMRDPWYSVPDVTVPQAFLSYMSGRSPTLTANLAGCVGTNSVHTVHLSSSIELTKMQRAWKKPLTTLSCELEGHPLGGGMLKIEPREAQRVALSFASKDDPDIDVSLMSGVRTLRAWRHCSASHAFRRVKIETIAQHYSRMFSLIGSNVPRLKTDLIC